MSRNQPLDDFLVNVIQNFEWHVYKQESHDDSAFLPPSLTNGILPMFTDRWASGPDQHTREFFHKLQPALQLTSLLLTENYPLRWFSHLTFGERHRSSSGTYIVPTAYSTSSEAISKVKANLQQLGQVITFMFYPKGWGETAWGLSYSSKYDEPKFRDFFRSKDWPPIPSHDQRTHPVIMMNSKFQEYFRMCSSTNSTITEQYRALLTFAVTLGHEVAHAYEMWLGGRGDEPRWSKDEKHSELGFSWESHVIGRVLNPMTQPMDNAMRFRKLCSLRLEEYGTEVERQQLIREFKGRTNSQFTTRDVAGRHIKWPMLNPREFRGAKWSLSRDATAIVAAIHALPSRWVVNWFQNDVWTRMKWEWAHRNSYVPPALENAFLIIYERNAHGAQIERPLNPYFPVDADILRQRAAKKKK